ncbi:hypothetical protein Tco_0428184 [Tanacetum coccineum]
MVTLPSLMVACCLGLDEFLSWLLVIHTVEMDKVKQIVDVESSGKSADEIDKETVSFGEMQLKQEDRSCVHASIELHLHAVHVFPTEEYSGNLLEWFLRELIQYIPLVGYTSTVIVGQNRGPFFNRSMNH